RTAAVSVTSKDNARALPPQLAISRATSSSWLRVRLTKISSAPAVASASATARPIPRPAPVTSAVLPSIRKALSADVAGIRFQKPPHCGPRLLPPAFIEIAEPRSEARGIGGIDLHAEARELLRTCSVDLLDVVALQ